MEERRNQEYICENPCQRVGKAYCAKPKQRDKHETCNCSCHHLKGAGKHCEFTKSHTLNQKTDNINERKREIEQRIGPDKPVSIP